MLLAAVFVIQTEPSTVSYNFAVRSPMVSIGVDGVNLTP